MLTGHWDTGHPINCHEKGLRNYLPAHHTPGFDVEYISGISSYVYPLIRISPEPPNTAYDGQLVSMHWSCSLNCKREVGLPH